ncbi:MAG: hypothetical protein GY759_11275 [Chloroflexi bacterium]|nr:hypothetical protein [Chloroflexota bacterium]
MIISQQTVADKLADYLYRKISLNELVDWAEWAMMQGEFEGWLICSRLTLYR